MSRITSILNNVRVDLGDTSSSRYDNDILIRHLNSGINDFVMATKCLKERIYVGLNYSSAIYDLRPYALDFIRAEYMGRSIEAKSFVELDKINPGWQSETGTSVKYITFDNLSKGMFRVYPRVEGSLDIIQQNSLYGGVIDITIGDDDYQIPSIEDVETNLNKYIALYVVKQPKVVTISTTDSELEINKVYDNAMEKYITSMCLRSDTDAQNRAYGNEQLQLYSNYVTSAKNSTAMSNNRIDDRVIPYRGGFQ